MQPRPHHELSIVALLLTGLLVGSSTSAERSRDGLETHTVRIASMQFEPQEIVVPRGSRVVWINDDLFPHTVTAKESFDSGSIAAGASWTYIAMQPGMYEYVCSLHPTMKGRMVVR